MAMENTVNIDISTSKTIGPFDVAGFSAVSTLININNWTGAVTCQGSLDGITWVPLAMVRQDGAVVTSGSDGYTANTVTRGFFVNLFGFSHFRVVVNNAGGTGNLSLGFNSYNVVPPFTSIANTVSVAGTVTVIINNPLSSFYSSTATTNATSVFSGTKTIYNFTLSNTGATPAYFKLYQKLSAPTVGTDIPIATFAIPANGNFVIDYALKAFLLVGVAFAITGLAPYTDTTAVAANQVQVAIMTS